MTETSLSAAGAPSQERIRRRFEILQRSGRAGLVPFIMAGDPDWQTSAAMLRALVTAGADLIELGMPFSDPMADGPVIQASALRALQAGNNLTQSLALVAGFRQHDQNTPIILMGYYNPIYRFGLERFYQQAYRAGVDGVIVVDLPQEEDGEFRSSLPGLDLICLVAPTTDDRRLPVVLRGGSGFVYYISVTGTTGAGAAKAGDIRAAVVRLRRYTQLPIAAGFGIRTPEQAAAIAREVDAIVVGSAVVARVGSAIDQQGRVEPGLVGQVSDFVKVMAGAVRTARMTG